MSRCIGNFSQLVESQKGRSFLIFGAASVVKDYKSQITAFIKKSNALTIGINKMTHIYVPDYHVWGNNQRLRDFGDCIKPSSTVIFGSGLKEEVKNKWDVDYYNLDYHDYSFESNVGGGFKYINGKVFGSFRTFGNTAIYLAHLMGAKHVYCVGISGYAQPYKGDQHCYGKGLTDLNGNKGKAQDMEYEAKKDAIVYESLKELRKVVNFSIITPTTFKDLYNGDIL